MHYFATLYRRLVDYLNDSSDLPTGSHAGQPPSCSWYSGLSENGSERHRF